MRGMANLPQGNQELLAVKDKVGRPHMSLGSASPWNVIFSLQCFDTVGWATGRASGLLKKTRCWFVGGDDLTGALHDL